jgi:hypothetical protein
MGFQTYKTPIPSEIIREKSSKARARVAKEALLIAN